MPRYRCVRGVVVPDPKDPHNPRAGTRYLPGDVFDADPPTRLIERVGRKPQDWLDWAVRMRVLIPTDEATSGPGLAPKATYPSEPRLQEDGSFAEAEPETEHID